MVLLSLAAAKAPDFDAARQVISFLHLGLGGEEGLFQQAFRERGLSKQQVAALEYRPTTLHYSGYLRKAAYEGSFIDVNRHDGSSPLDSWITDSAMTHRGG